VRAPILPCQLITIGAGWAAYDPALVVARFAGGRLPRAIVRHRTLDREYTAVVIGNNEEKRFVGIVSRHQFARAASDTVARFLE
jgi:hypothetical protein